ncbi:hypothetical protein ILUMI_18383, partial [Ignelater luminosus]
EEKRLNVINTPTWYVYFILYKTNLSKTLTALLYQADVFNDDIYFCGGTILAKNEILTVGHCCDDARSMEVVVGGFNIKQSESTQQTVYSKLIELLPNFNPFILTNDVCVVTLSSNIKLNGNTTKAVRLYQGNNSLEGEEAIVAGWGVRSDSTSSISPVLLHASDNVISNSECKRYFLIVRDSTICLNGRNRRSACYGDVDEHLQLTAKKLA